MYTYTYVWTLLVMDYSPRLESRSTKPNCHSSPQRQRGHSLASVFLNRCLESITVKRIRHSRARMLQAGICIYIIIIIYYTYVIELLSISYVMLYKYLYYTYAIYIYIYNYIIPYQADKTARTRLLPGGTMHSHQSRHTCQPLVYHMCTMM